MNSKVTGFVFTLIAIAAVGSQIVRAQYTAAGEAFPLVSPITIVSPANVTYSSDSLDLIVDFQSLLSLDYVNLTYSVDGQKNNTIPLTQTRTPREVTRTYANGTTVIANSTFWAPFEIDGVISLPKLEEGSHNITVYGKYTLNPKSGLDKKTVYFNINDISSLNQNIEQITEFPEWMPLLLVVFIVIMMIIIYRYILNKLE